MNDDSVVSVAQLSAFVKYAKAVKFRSNNKEETYKWMGKTLSSFRYAVETKKNRGIIKKYIIGVTGYSEGNIDKLIARKKQFGRIHISQKNASVINKFCVKYLNPFLNYHRPCAFATEIKRRDGKVKKVYKQEDYSIPVDKLLVIPEVEKYLKNGVTIQTLKKEKSRQSHFESAEEVSKERVKLFESITSKL